MSAQDRVQHYVTQLDRELSKYPTLTNLEKQTSVPKVYAVIGLATLYFFFIVFNLGGQLLTNFAGFIVPGYYSLAALFSTTKADDTQWLTYWVVFAFFSVLESAVSVVYWFPFYYTFNGAQLIFRSFMQPMLGRYFSESGSTAANLRAKADSFGKEQ
ncbi:TB2/DP1, HVA22 family-domain-containing protein [Hypoxylon crocopeplum]|nr:TB2/DP1, HVA22 family-domain-containing protein [Hypoxylon crocopeplum]